MYKHILVLFLLKEVMVPEEASVIDYTSKVSPGRAFTDLRGGIREACRAVSGGEVTPALKNGVNREVSIGFLRRGKRTYSGSSLET